MNSKQLLYLAGLIVLSVFVFMAGWEFVGEDLVEPIVSDFDKETTSDRWKHVSLAAALTGIALIIPVLMSLKIITERQRIRAALHETEAIRKSEERLRGAIESMQEGVALFDGDDRLVAINDGFRRVSPAAEELMKRGGTFEDVLRTNVAEGTIVDAIGREEEFIRERMEQHRNPEGILVNRLIDGRWYMLREARTPEGGTALSFIDITELKQAEEETKRLNEELEERVKDRTNKLRESERRLKEAQKIGKIGYWRRNIATGNVEWSDQMYRIFGCDRETFDPTFEKVRAMFHPDDLEMVETSASDALAGKKNYSIDSRINLAGKTTKWIHVVARVIRDDQGAPVQFEGTIQDITERKHAEQAAREREAELADIRRQNILGETAAAVAHELSQPLAVISSYAQGVAARLRSGDASLDDLLEPLENLNDQAKRAGEIIRSIRSLIGKRGAKKELVDLNAAIEEALALVTPEYQELGIGVTLDLQDGLPPVLADKIQVQQLIGNLVRNSLEAISESASASSGLRILSSRADDDTVEVAVEDTGPGFPPKARESIFEPFFTTKTQGLGLGLSICRSITEAHGGRIWVDPAPGTGASVRFKLPIADERQLENA